MRYIELKLTLLKYELTKITKPCAIVVIQTYTKNITQ